MRAIDMYWLFRLFLTSLMLGLTLAVSTLASGAGVVGNGTPASCTEAALAAALQGGGAVSFACGAEPVEITVTRRHEPAVDTQIDGGGLVTLSAGRRSGVLGVQGTFVLRPPTCGHQRATHLAEHETIKTRCARPGRTHRYRESR